jgi:hypothetical protein
MGRKLENLQRLGSLAIKLERLPIMLIPNESVQDQLDDIRWMISRLLKLTKLILTEKGQVMSALSDLQAAVARNGDVEASAVALIQGIAQQLKDAAGDPAALAALSASLTSQADALAAAVTANTPAA